MACDFNEQSTTTNRRVYMYIHRGIRGRKNWARVRFIAEETRHAKFSKGYSRDIYTPVFG